MTEQVNWGALIEQAGTELEPVPKGSYDVTIEDCTDTQSQTQKLMYKLKLRINGGPFNNRVLWNNITLTTDNPSALAMFFRNMEAFGLDRNYFAMNPSPSEVAAALIGRSARVVIDHRMYQGSIRENVKQILKAGVGVGAMIGIPAMGASAAPAVAIPVAAPAPIAAAPIPAPATSPAPASAAPPAVAQPVPAPVAEPTPPPVPEVSAPAPVVATPPPAAVHTPPVTVAPTPEPSTEPSIDLDAYRAAGWTDQQLIDAGHMAAPAAPAPPVVDSAAPAGPPAPPPVPF